MRHRCYECVPSGYNYNPINGKIYKANVKLGYPPAKSFYKSAEATLPLEKTSDATVDSPIAQTLVDDLPKSTPSSLPGKEYPVHVLDAVLVAVSKMVFDLFIVSPRLALLEQHCDIAGSLMEVKRWIEHEVDDDD